MTAQALAQVERLGLTLVAGAQAADRDIAWAHAIELADPTPYLAGGELVMTTGINIGTDRTSQFEYVARLSSAGAAALAFDTGTTFSDVPAGLLAAGDEVGLPVLKVPASTPFIAIAREVIDALKADELAAVQRVVDRQEVLARATLRDGIPGVVSALAESLSATVVVVGTDGTVLAGSGAQQERVITMLARTDRSARRQAGYVTADGDAFVTVQKLRAAQPIRGSLAVRTTQPMSNSDRLLVAHAVSLISIAIEKPARVVDAEQLLRTAVAREMLSGSGLVDSGVLRYFEFDPDEPVVVVLVHDVGPMLSAEHHLGQQLRTTGAYLMAPMGDAIVIVLPATTSGPRIRAALNQFQPTPGGGASQPVRIADIGIGLEQARIAAQPGGGRFVEFSELGTLGVLLGGRSTDELRVFADPLTPLSENGDELLTTLEAFLRCNGQVEAAAAELRIHRHTMRNRMRRIGELLADDIDSADKRAQLWLALRARQVLTRRQTRP